MFSSNVLAFAGILKSFADLCHAVPGCDEFEDRAANGWTPARSRAMSTDMETREYLNQLEEAATIDVQADILHFLYNTK